ncbi:MAG TPA: 2-dehydropantoate 2-reductase N-terminal domain-containing protein [Acidimicrobiales bacterium]|nr:2-dehydropantoate 2-reductase N-terminal domain-containing protein [Acidimicrobiales bacterium]
MRFVVYGAGAVGGVVGARLFEHGHQVVLIARGDHYRAIRDGGLRIQDPTGEKTLPIPVVDHPSRLQWTGEDIALVAVKSQHTSAILSELATVAPPELPIVCLHNGVANEAEALRRFANVYAVPVASPTAHLQPGVVQAYSSPITGILDIGRYHDGVDDVAVSVAAAFAISTFDSQAIPNVARWKWRKLITNLGNAIEAVFGPSARSGPIGQRAAAEGEACLAAAGIDVASPEEDRERRGDLLKLQRVDGQKREGGSSWQSLARRAPDIESDYLNGEVVLLGRLHRVPTPVNALLQRLANRLAAAGAQPGSITPDEFEGLLASEPSS